MRNNRKVSNSSPTGNLDNAFRTLDPCELFDARRVKERGYYEMCDRSGLSYLEPKGLPSEELKELS